MTQWQMAVDLSWKAAVIFGVIVSLFVWARRSGEKKVTVRSRLELICGEGYIQRRADDLALLRLLSDRQVYEARAVFSEDEIVALCEREFSWDGWRTSPAIARLVGYGVLGMMCPTDNVPQFEFLKGRIL